jgi:hypothetical protein
LNIQTSYKSQSILLGFVLSLAFLLTAYKSLTLGHFGDGAIYTSMARNMAEGFGTFWRPYFSDELFPVFYEHPSFIIFLKSLLFKVFGDSLYFEGLYSLFIGSLLLFLTHKLWQISNPSKVTSWWVILLLILLPYFTYALDSGLLVVTFSVLFLTSVYLSYQAQHTEKYFGLTVLASLFIYLGFISKGPVIFAVFSLPLISFITLKTKLNIAIKTTLIMVFIFSLLFFLTLYFSPNAKEFWSSFWQSQIITSLSGTRGISNYWQLPEHFISEIMVPIIIISFIVLLQKKTKINKLKFSRHGLFFLLLAIASSLPFFLSARQHNHYIFQSWFLFILALAHFTIPIAKNAYQALDADKKLKSVYLSFSFLIIISTIFVLFFTQDKVNRRQDFYNDFYLQNIKIPPRTKVNFCPFKKLAIDGGKAKITPSLQRIYKASWTRKKNAPFLIIDKNENCTVPENYFLVHKKPTKRYLLYQRK